MMNSRLFQLLLLLVFDFLIELSSSVRIEHQNEGVVEYRPDDPLYPGLTPRVHVKYSNGDEKYFTPIRNQSSLTSPEFHSLILQRNGEHYQIPQEIHYHGNAKQASLAYYPGNSTDPHDYAFHVQRYMGFNPVKYVRDTMGGHVPPSERMVLERPPYSFLQYDNREERECCKIYPRMKAQYDNNDTKVHVYRWGKPAMTPEYFKFLRQKNARGEWKMPRTITHEEVRSNDGPTFHYVAERTRVDPATYHGDYVEQQERHRRGEPIRTEASINFSGEGTLQRKNKIMNNLLGCFKGKSMEP